VAASAEKKSQHKMCEIKPKPLGARCKKISTKKSVQKNRHFFSSGANGQLSRNLQKKEKAEKFYFYLRQQLLRKTSLDPIFSESRFGTIANKNKKRITAGTH
jgi:hypothetical protein